LPVPNHLNILPAVLNSAIIPTPIYAHPRPCGAVDSSE
jgi:hypothetical protein